MTRRQKRRRRRFGAIRQYRSGRWTASYLDRDGCRQRSPGTFASKAEAEIWLALVEAGRIHGYRTRPAREALLFQAYAATWVAERDLRPTTRSVYDGLLRRHILPVLGCLTLRQITASKVRSWHATLRLSTGASTAAKCYRLLKAVLATAVDDELLERNPCRIRGAGREDPDERPVATVEQVLQLAELIGRRWRLMILLAAFATLRPEELAALRKDNIDVNKMTVRITTVSPTLSTGKRVTGPPKTRAGKRTVHLPSFLQPALRQHLANYAEKEADGLIFVGERGAPYRPTTFGRKFRRACAQVTDLPTNFTLYDLRHTGNTLLAEEGVSLKDLMVRMGHSSVRAAVIYQHSTGKRQQQVAATLNDRVGRAQGNNDLENEQPPEPQAPTAHSGPVAPDERSAWLPAKDVDGAPLANDERLKARKKLILRTRRTGVRRSAPGKR